MNTFDILINVVLVALVLRQIHERRVELRDLIRPVVLIGIVATHYLHTIPTAGNDLVLIVLLAAAGVTLGGVCARVTHVRPGPDGVAMARAGGLAAALWIGGIGSRMGFAYAAAHGAGPAIGHFSAAHHISPDAWTAAFVLMAIGEAVTRLLVLQLRARRVAAGTGFAPAATIA